MVHEFEPINCIDSYNKMVAKQNDEKFNKLTEKFHAQLRKEKEEREIEQIKNYRKRR